MMRGESFLAILVCQLIVFVDAGHGHENESSDKPTHAAQVSSVLHGASSPGSTRANTEAMLSGVRFPNLPPPPNAGPALPPLDTQLDEFGGSSIFNTFDEREQNFNDLHGTSSPIEPLRLPPEWQAPQPLTLFAPFEGTGPIQPYPRLHWPGTNGYVWEPRFVGYGSYQLFGFAFEQNNQRRDAIGHQLLVDLDLRLTGTERFHVQYRPVGEGATGGSYYQFNSPSDYIDNSTAVPDRYWFEGELHSILGGWVNPFQPLDFHIVGGKFPVLLHNSLLLNDDILGVAVNKNNVPLFNLSNLNLQFIHGANDVDAFVDDDADLYLFHASADHWGVFWQASYAFVRHDSDRTRDANYVAASRTALHGPITLSLRFFTRWEEEGDNSAQLYVLEANRTFKFEHKICGYESAVAYLNIFKVTEDWAPIAGGNFNRLRTSFETNPLTRIAGGLPTQDSWGVALGAQLFRDHQNQSLVPEIAFESPNGTSVTGLGIRYQLKTSARTFFEAQGVVNFSDDPQFRREGIFLSETILF